MGGLIDRRKLFLGGCVGAVSASRQAAWTADAPRIRVGQIGTGHAHAGKLAVYRQSPDYEVVGVVEDDPELRRRADGQEAFRGVPWMSREQLLGVPGLKAVLVETPVGQSLAAAAAAVQAGMHVHLDKPAGESLPAFRAVLREAERKRLLLQMGYMYRYNPAVVLLRRCLREGLLGQVFEIHAVMSKVISEADRKKLLPYRGGLMFELGCHLIDLVVAIAGRPMEVNMHSRHAAPIKDGLRDNMLAVFGYERAIATVKSSAMEVDGSERRHLTVCGTGGTFHIQPLDNPVVQVTLAEAGGALARGRQTVNFPKYVRHVDDAADMARIIRGEKAADFSYAHDLNVQETLLRACGLPLGED